MELVELKEAIKGLTLMEASTLVKELEDELGVSAAAPVAVAAAPAAGEAGAAAEEKDSFDVVLTSFGDKKINVIKTVRELTSLGLKEAKELVESVPAAIREEVTKEEAEDAKKRLEEAGGQVELK